MAGLIGMAQTLAVFHFGYHTLKRREVQFHGTTRIPTDAAAILDWGLDTPFTSQDRPPLAIAMTATVDRTRCIRRYRLVVAQKSKLRLSPEASTAFLYGYAADGYRSPLWICAAYDGVPVLVHRQRGTRLYFHQAIHEKKIIAIPGIHYFDAHRLEALLLTAPELQLYPRAGNPPEPEGAGDVVADPSSDEELTTSDEEDTSDEVASEDLKWCPPNPDAQDDPTEEELVGAADKLDTMMTKVQPPFNIFFTPASLGALPALWLQAKLTISLAPFQEKFAKLFQTIAVELWLRGRSDDILSTFQGVARSFTIRVAERLAKYICSLMRNAATLATPETECLLYASYWFRPILSELIGAATETAPINRTRAPSGPVKVSVPTQPQERPHGGISLTSGVAALLAWFPASWASKVVPYFLAQGGAPQPPQEVTIPCPTREAPGLQRDQRARTLQAVRFVDKRAPGINLGIDEDYQASQCFTEVIRGYRIGVIEPATMHSFQPTGPIRVSLEVITPSQGGITPEQWNQTATLCPLDWPTNYSLLRLWHHPTSLHQFADVLYKQMDHRHMFTQWSLDLSELAERAMVQQPATYFTDAALQEHWRNLDFPSRKLRRRPTQADLAAFRTKKADLQRMLQHKNNLIQSPFPLRIAGPKQYKTTKLFTTIIRYSARRRLPPPLFLFPPAPLVSHF